MGRPADNSRTMDSLVCFSPTGPSALDDAAVQARVAAGGLSAADVRLRLRGGRLCVLRRGGDRAGLELAARSLAALGDAAAVVADDELRAAPPARLARALRVGPSELEFLGADGERLAGLPAGAPVTLVVANLLKPAPAGVAGLKSADAAPADAAALRRDGEARLRRLMASELEGVFLDLAWADSAGRIRIRGGRFQFSSLGDLAGPSATGNLRALFDLIARHSGQALLDLEFGLAPPPARGLMVVGLPNGRAFDHPGSEAEADFEHYSRFVHHAAARGLFDTLLAARLPAGVPAEWRLTRAAAPARDAAATPAPRPFWTPAARSAPLTRRLNGLAAFGPPWAMATLVAAAGLGGGAALNAPGPGTIGGALLPLGLALLLHARTLFERRRRVEDVPTSRVRSAALGPVEICGETEPVYELRTPFSLLPCVYYEFTAVREPAGSTGGGPPGRSPVAQWLTTRSPATERATRWHGSSGDVPFRVRDDTGVLTVDPAGAIVEVTRAQVLHNPPLAAGLHADGSRVTVTERYIPVGFPVYVMGELKRLDVARSAPRVALGGSPTGAPTAAPDDLNRLVLGRPVTGGLFLVSERSERELIRGLRLRFDLALILGTFALAMGAWQLSLFLKGIAR